LDAIGKTAVNDLRTWFCEYMLAPYIELFRPGQEHASFSNTKRRFAWYKRVMKEAMQVKKDGGEQQGTLFEIFPPSWQMP